jgi:hypothetical protein
VRPAGSAASCSAGDPFRNRVTNYASVTAKTAEQRDRMLLQTERALAAP